MEVGGISGCGSILTAGRLACDRSCLSEFLMRSRSRSNPRRRAAKKHNSMAR